MAEILGGIRLRSLNLRSEQLLAKRVELPTEYDWERWVLELEDHWIEDTVHNKMVRRIRGLALALLGARL